MMPVLMGALFWAKVASNETMDFLVLMAIIEASWLSVFVVQPVFNRFNKTLTKISCVFILR